ncbi:hypothetical protein FFT09_14505 [Saccharomonospora piscinae]|uniref:hypothetical protein n=1 Tax=Saccharomonospora piscinae TaxID=687388 RepID=UPI0011072B71|nr:hypothetical protein [Saccharomonospora piscinae]TLW92090.1 hypothetical protein FFT09_14505 [Saccharomonospora piscinae]
MAITPRRSRKPGNESRRYRGRLRPRHGVIETPSGDGMTTKQLSRVRAQQFVAMLRSPRNFFTGRNQVDHIRRNFEFEDLAQQALLQIMNPSTIMRNYQINSKSEVDFFLEFENGRTAVVDVKTVTPGTRSRLHQLADQLHFISYKAQELQGNKVPPERILVIPGVLSLANREFLLSQEIRVIDGNDIRNAGVNLQPEPYKEEFSKRESEYEVAQSLQRRLSGIEPGKSTWSEYQSTCKDILEFLLCPPLKAPIAESANKSGVNRRDIIFPNYATGGFWAYMRSFYEAHYIVVDAKNYAGQIKKQDILQLANYLSPHGSGLFGMIVTQGAKSDSAEVTIREQWYMHKKMIIILDNDDLGQMLTMKAALEDPSTQIRQKIEDFRLAF